MKSILVVSPSFPYPSDYGGGVDIWRRIKSLVKLGYKVDLLATVKSQPVKEDIEYVKGILNDVLFVERENKAVYLLSKTPLQVKSRAKLRDISLSNAYDITILEGDYVGMILENKSLHTKHILLRNHNDESKYFKKLAFSSGINLDSLYYISEFLKFKYYVNSYLFNKIKNILFISSEEYAEFVQRKLAGFNVVHLPTPINISDYKSRDLTGGKIVFVGSLFMVNNQEAILWYLNNVHSSLLRIPDYQLIIAGSTKGHDISSFLGKIKDYPSVHIEIDVPDLELIYNQASIFINPMRSGAGVKIKSINAIIEGIPLISTSVGVEGIGLIHGQNYINANTPYEFILSVETLLKAPAERVRLAENAQKFLLEHNHDQVLNKFIQKLAN
ncbi:hypothetical protein GCM10028895_05060 [Pontibacter rugosus]